MCKICVFVSLFISAFVHGLWHYNWKQVPWMGYMLCAIILQIKDMNDVQMSAAKPVAEKTEIMQMRLPSCTCR